jgi:hypothetical protein
LRLKFTLQNIAKSLGMEISPKKSETKGILGQDPVRRQIVEDEKCLQKAKDFKYLGCEIFYENEKKVFNKNLAKFSQIL